MSSTSSPSFTFIDLFAGIGGFRLALEKLGGKCIAFSEILPSAIQTYQSNFQTSNEEFLGDITKITDTGNLKADIVTGGVPCQSWSIAGKRQGFEDPRGALWFDTIKFVQKVSPKGFIFENVKGLADPRNKANLNLIIDSFEQIGYDTFYKVLNAFDFGLPQNRERIFIVGVKKEINTNSFKFPSKNKFLPNLTDILELNATIKSEAKLNSLNIRNSFNISAITNKGHFFTFCDTRNGEFTIHSWDILPDITPKLKSICMLILKHRRSDKYGDKDGNPLTLSHIQSLDKEIILEELDDLVSKKILIENKDGFVFVNSKNSAGINDIYRIFLPSSLVFSTLTRTGSKDFIATENIPDHIQDKKGYFLKQIFLTKKYRSINTVEALKLQGFPKDYKFNVSDRVAMQLLGNAVAVNVVEAIAINLLNCIFQLEIKQNREILKFENQPILDKQLALF